MIIVKLEIHFFINISIVCEIFKPQNHEIPKGELGSIWGVCTVGDSGHENLFQQIILRTMIQVNLENGILPLTFDSAHVHKTFT